MLVCLDTFRSSLKVRLIGQQSSFMVTGGQLFLFDCGCSWLIENYVYVCPYCVKDGSVKPVTETPSVIAERLEESEIQVCFLFCKLLPIVLISTGIVEPVRQQCPFHREFCCGSGRDETRLLVTFSVLCFFWCIDTDTGVKDISPVKSLIG